MDSDSEGWYYYNYSPDLPPYPEPPSGLERWFGDLFADLAAANPIALVLGLAAIVMVLIIGINGVHVLRHPHP